MRAYSVEIFDRNFAYKDHDNVDEVAYNFDYLSPADSSIEVSMIKAARGDLIRISNGNVDYLGIITETAYKNNDRLDIKYKPFASILNVGVLFDTDLRGGSESLEQVIADYIKAYYVNNTDPEQNIKAIGDIKLTSTTTSWGFNLKSDKVGMHMCIVNLYDSILTPAFNKYKVAVRAVPDYQTRKINILIGKVARSVMTLESDLSNIISKNVAIRQTSNDVNKLRVYNTSNYSQMRTYFLHPDGTYDQTNTNRITPVVMEVKGADVEEGSSFDKEATSVAAESFGQISYSNLIELYICNDDELIDPAGLEIGQTVNVIHDGVSYASIYSGIEIGTTTKLIFGSIRLDLTKIIKGGYK